MSVSSLSSNSSSSKVSLLCLSRPAFHFLSPFVRRELIKRLPLYLQLESTTIFNLSKGKSTITHSPTSDASTPTSIPGSGSFALLFPVSLESFYELIVLFSWS